MDDKKKKAQQVIDLIDLKLTSLLAKNKKVDIHVTNLKDIPRPIVTIPSEMSIKRPVWVRDMVEQIAELLKDEPIDKPEEETLVFQVDKYSAKKIYIGHATPGSTNNDPVWRIRRITITKDTVLSEYADGNANFDNIWSKRDFLDYL